MGFGGGGSSSLPNHQHSNVPLTGGPLDLSNVTVGSLAAGSVVYSNGAALQELVKPAVPAGEILTFPALATSPSWGAAGAGSWEILYNARDTAAANSLDTGAQTAWGTYRVLKYFWSAYVDTGTAALDMRFYNPDGNAENAAIQGVAGFYNSNVLNQTANQSSYDLTFGGSIADDRNIGLEMTVQCASVKNYGGSGNYSITQRGSAGDSYNVTFCQGNLAQAWNSGLVSPNLMYYCGCQEQSGNTYTDALLTVLGMGDNTS